MQQPKAGAFALCSKGSLGLITSKQPEKVSYADKTVGFAWTGIHLTDRIAPLGSPWSSRSPIILAYLSDVEFNKEVVSSWQSSAYRVSVLERTNIAVGDLLTVKAVCKIPDAPAPEAPPTGNNEAAPPAAAPTPGPALVKPNKKAARKK